MQEWWANLSGANQVFYILAAFFSAVFLWQFIASLIGLSGGEADVDAVVDADGLEAGSFEDAADTTAAFRLVSLRAILAFCTLFSWAMALYLDLNTPLGTSLIYAFLWGAAGWVLVVALVHMLLKLSETGTRKLSSCVGKLGTVYMNIPARGRGKIRVLVSGAMSTVPARSHTDEPIQAGTDVRVLQVLDNMTVEVESADGEHERE
jgi:hypothetical protein